jgi:hypothetical protein
MDPLIFRFVERGLAVLIGGLAIYLGYRLFLKIPKSHNSEGKITLPWNITVILSRVGPGVFFALFGSSVVAFSLYKGLEFTESTANRRTETVASRQIDYAAPTPSGGERAAGVDARALLRKDIAILNNITISLRPDLPEQDRASIELAIPRIKFALMRPIWGEPKDGWGTPSDFEVWLTNRGPQPAPPQIAQAVEYFEYGMHEVSP